MTRRSTALLAGAGLLATAALTQGTPGAAAAPQADPDATSITDQAAAFGLRPDQAKPESKTDRQGKPAGSNPLISLLPDPDAVDYVAWEQYLQKQARKAAAKREARVTPRQARAAKRDTLVHDEQEPDGTRGSNDTYEIAEPVDGFGTGGQDSATARILGSLDNEAVSVEDQDPNVEDDGSIPLARDTAVGTDRDGFATTGTIGDGPHGSGSGSGSGDFDVYEMHGKAGETLTVDTDTPTGPLDTLVVLFDSEGELVAANDDEDFDNFDSKLSFSVPADGDYYAFVTGYFVLPDDPFDSASGTGADSEGPYDVTITQGAVDVDVYAVDLEVSDVLGLTISGGASVLGILDGSGELVHGSEQDSSSIYPLESPLPGGGNAANEHVADEDGWHYVAVSGGSGGYDVTAEVYRPGLEGNPPPQKIFLDFDGARVNTGIFGGAGVRNLSPLRSFLGRWGLTNADYRPLVNQITATVRENLRHDMLRSGVNPDFDIRIRNSLNGRDTFGQPNVSRLIVGGTIEQSGVATIGIAESIDPGNYAQEESALILLDVLSGPDDDPASLNTYITPQSDKIKFIGTAIGNVSAHEAGHYLGDWHVDQNNEVLNIMDQGGNFPLLYGVGPDGVGGTADDPDVDFGEDEFNPNEGFTGTEDTLTRIEASLFGN